MVPGDALERCGHLHIVSRLEYAGSLTAVLEWRIAAIRRPMLRNLRGLFSRDLSIDLGTANTLIYAKEKGIILDEPSVVAIREDRRERRVLAVGSDAKRMLGRTPINIKAIRPLKDGVIADDTYTKEMLRRFIGKVQENAIIRPSPRVIVSVPCRSTLLERKAIRDSALSAGSRDVRLIEEPMAAAIGAGLPVHEAVGTMVVDIGGGTTEIAVVSLSGIVYSDTIRVGGDRFDENILNYVRRAQGTLIGEAMAEHIKYEIGVAYPQQDIREISVRGRNLSLGVPRKVTLNSNDVLEALQEPLATIVQEVKNALEHTPPELAADIAETGIVLTGGGALLKDLDVLLAEETGLPVVIAEDPLTCVARGAGKAVEDFAGYLDLLWTE